MVPLCWNFKNVLVCSEFYYFSKNLRRHYIDRYTSSIMLKFLTCLFRHYLLIYTLYLFFELIMSDFDNLSTSNDIYPRPLFLLVTPNIVCKDSVSLNNSISTS